MRSVESAILRTILYADVFHFPLTDEEIHHYLIHDDAVSLETVKIALQSISKQSLLIHEFTYYALPSRTEIIALRRERERITQKLMPLGKSYGKIIAQLPFVRMVAITGALAVHNPDSIHDDFDYFIITEPRRVWLTRALTIVLVRLARLQGITLCPNYVLAGDRLEQSRKDLFIAHEISQMVPVYGLDVYRNFRQMNNWTDLYQPNAQNPFYDEVTQTDKKQFFKRFLEWILSGWVGNKLEDWEYQRKKKRFAPHINEPTSSAEIDRSHVKGHFNDYGNPVLKKYYEKLEQYGLDYQEYRQAGD